MTTNHTHPGRPALPETKKRKPISVFLHPAILTWMAGQKESRGKLIETAVIEHFGLKNLKIDK